MTAARTARGLGSVAAALAALAALVGLLVPGFYARDPVQLQPQLLGQDAVTLLLAAPLLLLGARAAARGSLRGEAAMAGLLLYLAYTYATYAFGVRFNALFPLYVAILGLSSFGLFLALAGLLRRPLAPAVWTRLPRRALAAILLGTAAAFTLLWGSDIWPAWLSGAVPQAALEAQMPTSPIHVLDLAFVLPLAAATGVLLMRRHPWGPLLGGVMVVKTATLGLAVLSMAVFSARAGQPVNAAVAATMAAVVLGILAVGWRTFEALGPAPRASSLGSATPRGGLMWAMVPLLGLIAASALPVGWELARVPSGASLGMDVAWLRTSLFPDYFVPGTALFILGVLHLVGLGAVVVRPALAWVPAGAAGVGDMVWIAVQVVSIPLRSPLQPAVFLAGLALAAIAFVQYRRWHLRWGATEAEAAMALPGDERFPRPHFAATRAITVAASPGEVWPWLVQMGHGRAGFYSYDRLDNQGRPSLDRIEPALQGLQPGDWVPMAATVTEDTAFRVSAMDPPRTMVWAKPDSTWTWHLAARPDGTTRLVARLRLTYRRRGLLLSLLLMEVGDFPMMRRCLRGIRERAERLHRAGLVPSPGRPAWEVAR